jgi:hypothetical protein
MEQGSAVVSTAPAGVPPTARRISFTRIIFLAPNHNSATINPKITPLGNH